MPALYRHIFSFITPVVMVDKWWRELSMSRQVYQSSARLHISFLILFCVVFSGCGVRQAASHNAAARWYSDARNLLERTQASRGQLSQAVVLLHNSYVQKPCAFTAALLATTLLQLCDSRQSVVWFDRARKSARSVALYHEITNNYACALAQLGLYNRAMKLWYELAQTATYEAPFCAWRNLGFAAWAVHKHAVARSAWASALVTLRLHVKTI